MPTDHVLPDRLSMQGAITNLDEAGIDAIERVILTRRSVRAFLPDPVPRSVLDRIFEVAQSAPSNCNVQPWRIYVASGAARDRIKAALVSAVTERVRSNHDFENDAIFKDGYRKLQIECAVALYFEMDIARDDMPGRIRAGLRNYELFDAPHVAFVGMAKEFGPTVALDVGMYVQTLMLLMNANGIASCAMGSLRDYPDIVRAELNVPDDIGLLCGMTFGYEDVSIAANRTRTTRSSFSENVEFKES